MIKVFPYFLCRIGGNSFEKLASLNLAKSPKEVDRILELNLKSIVDKDFLCQKLHETIAFEDDTRKQNMLLGIKRNVYNGRVVKVEDVEAVSSVISSRLKSELLEFISLQDELKTKEAEARRLFQEELAVARDRLKVIAREENLQKGLLLSSQLLLNSIPGYVERESGALRKKELKTEESLIKYLTRMCAKTSPFSTFTNLCLGEIVPEKQKEILQLKNGNTKIVTSHICLNNHLYGFLKAVLLKLPEVYRWFHIRPNPTIRLHDENYVFLTNSNNIEAFQRIEANPVVELLFELTKDRKEGIVYSQLTDDIIENEYFDATASEIEAYLNQLIGFGFLEFNIGVSGIDPAWDTKLVEVLEKIKSRSPLIADLIEALKGMRGQAVLYEKADIEERKIILNKAFQLIREIAYKLHEAAGLPEDERKSIEERQKIAAEKKEAEENQNKEPAGKEPDEAKKEDEAFVHLSNTYFHFKPEQIFYEDTSCNVHPVLSEKEVNIIIDSLDVLLNTMHDFELYLDDNEKMQQFFLTKYGSDAAIDIMTFYEDYFREVKRPEADRLAKTKEEKKEEDEKNEQDNAKEKEELKPVIEVPKTRERHLANKEAITKLTKTIVGNNVEPEERIDFEYEDLFKQTRKEDPYLRSYGCFVQVYNEDGQQKAVINSTFPGYGKMFSRFLHILDKQLTMYLRTWNQPHTIREIFIENCDASYFNANLHPPLMPYEIWMPGGHNTLPADAQIPITDLDIVYDDKEDKLKLKHAQSGREAYVFDLGFQGARGRSQLFQLLSRFSLMQMLYWQPITNGINQHVMPKDEPEKLGSVIVLPRIVFEERLVLQRKSWRIKKEALPQMLPTESEWEYFLKVNLWRKELELPDEVFIFITQHGELEQLKPEEAAKLGRDSYKPQYINFNNAILVSNLFEKMVAKVPKALKIEEMLPNSSQMLKASGERYVTEFMIQWYENNVPS